MMCPIMYFTCRFKNKLLFKQKISRKKYYLVSLILRTMACFPHHTSLKKLLMVSASHVATVDTFGKTKSTPVLNILDLTLDPSIQWNTVFPAIPALRNICYMFILKQFWLQLHFNNISNWKIYWFYVDI